MFDIHSSDDGTVILAGRLDALSAPVAREFLTQVNENCRLDFQKLEYIASAGLGVLAATQKRLLTEGKGLILAGLNPHLREVMALAGFESFFTFE